MPRFPGLRAGLLACISLLAFLPVRAQTTLPEWRATTALPEALVGHRTLLLPTGEILVSGGMTPDGATGRTSLLYSSATRSYRPTLNRLNNGRAWHELVAVPFNGSVRVLAIGGFTGNGSGYRGERSVEVLEYDAAADNWRWRPAGNLPVRRGDLRAAWDRGNFVVVTGGYESTGGPLRSGVRSTAAERINIATLAIETLPALNEGKAEHTAAGIIDDNGDDVMLVAGGEATPAATSTRILEGTVWNPIANPPLSYHSGGVGFGDPARIARTFGGFDAAGVPSDACEWYDVKRGWRSAPRMNSARARFDATLVAGLTDTALVYLAVAGEGQGGALGATELFHLPNSSFPNGSWTPFPTLVAAGSERQVSINGYNLPVVTGGFLGGAPGTGAEVFQPLRASDLDFGDEEIGRRSDSIQLSIRNEWLLPVRVRNFRIEGSAAFFFRGDTNDFVIPAESSRTIRLYFQPGSPGAHNGDLVFEVGELTDRVKLRGNGIASTLAVINAPFDMGAVFLNDREQLCFHMLRNNGTDTAVIDSITIDPSGVYRLVSPKGRASIPPGDSLRVCVEFDPDNRQLYSGQVTMHIANRALPGQIIGTGVRRFMTAAVLTEDCDTVLYEPGAEISGFVRIENPGDSTVRVLAPTLAQSVADLFRLADPTIFPLTLLPGESRLIEIIFSPARESAESVTVNFPNNGDTAAAADLCFIARSRYLNVSQSSLDFGSVCTGDTVTATLVLENPGGFDQVELFSAGIDPVAELTLSGFTPMTLGPRDYTRVEITWVPTGPGALIGELVVANSRGDLVVPITGEGFAAARFAPDNTMLAIGSESLLTIAVEDLPAGASLTNATLTFSYDPTLMLPLRLTSAPGGPTLDRANSSLTIKGGGTAQIELTWNGIGITGDGPAFGIEIETLRGDALRAVISVGGESGEGFCLADGIAVLDVVPPCWGEAGFIRTESASLVTVAPLPVSDKATVTIISPLDGEIVLEMIDMEGNRVATYTTNEGIDNRRALQLDTTGFPSGVYLLRGRAGERLVGTTTIVVR